MGSEELVARAAAAIRDIVERCAERGAPPTANAVREAFQAVMAADAEEQTGLQAVVLDYLARSETESLADLAEIAALWKAGSLTLPLTLDGIDAFRRRLEVARFADVLRSDPEALADSPASWALVEALCEVSREVAPEIAQMLAERADAVAEALPERDETVNLLAYVHSHQGQAVRRRGDIEAAGEYFRAMRAAAVMIGDGPEWDDDLEGYCPVALLHESHYLREIRRLPEALSLQVSAVSTLVGQRTRPPRPKLLTVLLISAAQSLYELSEAGAAREILQLCIEHLRQQLTGPLWLCVYHNLAVAHLDLGEIGAAREALQVAMESRPRPQDALSLAWTDGRVLLAEGVGAAGVARLLEVREQLAAQGAAYDVGLVSLELAEHHAGIGEVGMARSFAQEAIPMFAGPHFDREALVAVGYLSTLLAGEGLVRAEVARVRRYFVRARFDGQERFVPAS